MLHLQLIAPEGMRSAPPSGERHAHVGQDDGCTGVFAHEIMVDVSSSEGDGREVAAEGESAVEAGVLHLHVEQATVRAMVDASLGVDEVRLRRIERREGVAGDVEVRVLDARLLSQHELVDAQSVRCLEAVGGRALLLQLHLHQGVGQRHTGVDGGLHGAM